MSGPAAGPRPRLLLAEDDPELSDLLGQLLDAEGYDVDAARDGQSALHLALNARHDVAVLDRGLPYVEGLELLARLRGSGWSTPVLILSAYATLDDRVAGLDAGAEDYLVKPFDVEELLARLRALLRRHLADADVLALPGGRFDAMARTVEPARRGRTGCAATGPGGALGPARTRGVRAEGSHCRRGQRRPGPRLYPRRENVRVVKGRTGATVAGHR